MGATPIIPAPRDLDAEQQRDIERFELDPSRRARTYSKGNRQKVGLVAALALGADGINMGTRFMATKEAPIHQNVKEKIVSSDERSTSLIFRTMRNTSRVYGNSIAKKAIEMEHEGKTIQEIGPIVSGAKGRVVYETGDLEHGVWSAGTCMGLINDIPTCKEQGLDVDYLMLRGVFMAPGVPKEAVDYYVEVFKKVRETPEWKQLMNDGAFNQTFMSGPEFTKWVEAADKQHYDLMKEAGFLAPGK